MAEYCHTLCDPETRGWYVVSKHIPTTVVVGGTAPPGARLDRPFGHPTPEPTKEDPLRGSFGRPTTEPAKEDPLGGSFGRPTPEPTHSTEEWMLASWYVRGLGIGPRSQLRAAM